MLLCQVMLSVEQETVELVLLYFNIGIAKEGLVYLS